MSKKNSISSQLNTLYEFCAKHIHERPEIYAHAENLIPHPKFFSVQKLQDYLNNPLLTPEWLNIILRNEFQPMEEIAFSRVAQRKELRFIDKRAVDNYISRGAALALEGIEIMDRSINDFLGRIDDLVPCASSDCVALFSQKDNEAYGGHRDSDDVLVIHIAGAKNWKIFEPQQRRYFGNSPLSMQQMGKLVAEITMKPGDALYVRAGVPHICTTPHAYSLHLAFDLKDRITNIEQITQEANQRYNHANAEPFSPASDIVDKYVRLLKSPEFQADLKSANDHMGKEARLFRTRMGNSASVQALSKFIRQN